MIKSKKQKRVEIARRVIATLLPLVLMQFTGPGIIPFTIGFYMIYKNLSNLKKRRLFENIPTSKMGSVAMGIAELKGTVKAAKELIKDPFDGKDCVFWSVSIEVKNVRGRTKVHEASNIIPFLITDDTGSVLVQPRKADISHIVKDNDYHGGILGGSMTEKAKQYCDRQKIPYKSFFHETRCSVAYIKPNDYLYIIGNVRSVTKEEKNYSNHSSATIEYIKNDLFIISDKSEKQLIIDHGGNPWLIYLGIPLTVLGLVLILWLQYIIWRHTGRW